jgi:hypothetical protein
LLQLILTLEKEFVKLMNKWFCLNMNHKMHSFIDEFSLVAYIEGFIKLHWC